MSSKVLVPRFTQKGGLSYLTLAGKTIDSDKEAAYHIADIHVGYEPGIHNEPTKIAIFKLNMIGYGHDALNSAQTVTGGDAEVGRFGPIMFQLVNGLGEVVGEIQQQSSPWRNAYDDDENDGKIAIKLYDDGLRPSLARNIVVKTKAYDFTLFKFLDMLTNHNRHIYEVHDSVPNFHFFV